MWLPHVNMLDVDHVRLMPVTMNKSVLFTHARHCVCLCVCLISKTACTVISEPLPFWTLLHPEIKHRWDYANAAAVGAQTSPGMTRLTHSCHIIERQWFPFQRLYTRLQRVFLSCLCQTLNYGDDFHDTLGVRAYRGCRTNIQICNFSSASSVWISWSFGEGWSWMCSSVLRNDTNMRAAGRLSIRGGRIQRQTTNTWTSPKNMMSSHSIFSPQSKSDTKGHLVVTFLALPQNYCTSAKDDVFLLSLFVCWYIKSTDPFFIRTLPEKSSEFMWGCK